MKILFILHYPPPVHGAAMVGELIRSSIKINATFETEYINLSTSHSVDEIGKGGLIKWIRYLAILSKTISKCLTFKPDFIYITLSTTSPGLYKDSLVALLCKFLRFRVVYHLHNKGVQKNCHKPLEKRLYPWIFSNTNVILLSPHLYHDISNYVLTKNVRYCSNGIPEISLKKNVYSRPKTDQINLLFLSNLIKTKGIWDLMNSCKILNDKNVNFHCTVAGAEGDVTAMDLQVFIDENDLKKRISYIGKVSGAVKTKAFEEADLFIHPTHEDCFPLVLLEAMQHKLPTISTMEGAIPEIIKDNTTGFLVKKESPDAIAEAVIYLVQNPLKRQMLGNNAYHRFKENYTLNIFEDRLIQTFYAIMKSFN
jgi:glycosyltransferase involved in cell wall biosynthesis